jgi:drug/metabolite transporter (DMT)-like permease
MSAGSAGWRVWAALGTVYVVWGSTYLGIRVLVETAPPLLSTGLRFCCAGVLIALWVGVRGGRGALRVPREAIAPGALIGTLLVGGTGLVAVCEEAGAPSSYAALIFASIPLWVVLLRRLLGDRPPRATYVGVLAGYLGVAALLVPGQRPGGVGLGIALALLAAASAWALGSVATQRLPSAGDAALATALTTTLGGLVVIGAGTIAGEWADVDPGAISGRSVAAFAYLVLVGSVVGFSAYVWLLHHAPVSLVATYAYVNPVVALILGRLFFTEPAPALTLAGAAVIVGSVAFVVRREAAVDVPAEDERRLAV